MRKILVAYFSASGVTEDAAKKIAEATGGTLYEIRPETPYTKEDLNWQDVLSRSTQEMKNKACRPRMAEGKAPVAESNVVFLGFPIWWYTAPRIVESFLEAYSFVGKRIILFATSGSSGFGSTLADLKECLGPGHTVEEGIVVHGTQDLAAWRQWTQSLGL